MMLTHQ
jgi:hypothetical protein